jgi:hypothetical protein
MCHIIPFTAMDSPFLLSIHSTYFSPVCEWLCQGPFLYIVASITQMLLNWSYSIHLFTQSAALYRASCAFENAFFMIESVREQSLFIRGSPYRRNRILDFHLRGGQHFLDFRIFIKQKKIEDKKCNDTCIGIDLLQSTFCLPMLTIRHHILTTA